MIFQDPYASLNPRQTVEQIVVCLILHGTCPSQVRPKVKALLRRVGPRKVVLTVPHQFSGGQRQRMSLPGHWDQTKVYYRR